jgi:hypothetical protein
LGFSGQVAADVFRIISMCFATIGWIGPTL